MKKKLKTEVIIALFRLLNAAKYTKMEDGDKIKAWKILRALKPIAEKFDDDIKTSREKLKPEGYDELFKKAQQIEEGERKGFGDINSQQREQEFVNMLCEKYDDYSKFQDERRNFVKLCNDALREFAQADVELEFELLSESAFEKLMASNDWSLSQAGFLADNICA